jgi:hypothetical protein
MTRAHRDRFDAVASSPGRVDRAHRTEPLHDPPGRSACAAAGVCTRVRGAWPDAPRVGRRERPMTPVSRATAAGRAYLDLQNRARCEGRGTQEYLTAYVIERELDGCDRGLQLPTGVGGRRSIGGWGQGMRIGASVGHLDAVDDLAEVATCSPCPDTRSGNGYAELRGDLAIRQLINDVKCQSGPICRTEHLEGSLHSQPCLLTVCELLDPFIVIGPGNRWLDADSLVVPVFNASAPVPGVECVSRDGPHPCAPLVFGRAVEFCDVGEQRTEGIRGEVYGYVGGWGTSLKVPENRCVVARVEIGKRVVTLSSFDK